MRIILERSRRSGSQVTILMIDLEGFKEINDTHGHAAGDETLRRFAGLLRRSARAEDVVCRYGGVDLSMPGMTVGLAISPADGTTAAALLKVADARLYEQRHAERAGLGS